MDLNSPSDGWTPMPPMLVTITIVTITIILTVNISLTVNIIVTKTTIAITKITEITLTRKLGCGSNAQRQSSKETWVGTKSSQTTFELCLFKESWWWAATTTGAPVCGCLLQIGMYRSIFGFLPPGGLWGRVRAGF